MMISTGEIIAAVAVIVTVLGGVWKLSSQVTKVQVTVTHTSGSVVELRDEMHTNTAATQEVERKCATISERVGRLEAVQNSNIANHRAA
jgi:uncharacterized protein YoxC